MRYSIIAVAILVTSCSVSSQTRAPKIKIALYAPNKNNSPLRIMGFKYGDAAIGVLVRNDSDKTVSGFTIGGAVTASASCSERGKPARQGVQTGSGLKVVRIESHETVATSTSDPPFDPAGLITAAREAKAARISVSVVIGEVTFADGTPWRHRDDALSEVRLAGGSMETCTNKDISIVIDSLAKITTVGFKNGSALL